MEIGAITEYVDAAQVVLYVFWAFFALVIYHLIQENKREGYPLVTDELDPAKRKPIAGITSIPSPKEYLFEDGSKILVPDPSRADTRAIKATATAPHVGAAITPDGDPMLAEVGPGSYAERMDIPDKTWDGKPKIVPMSTMPEFHVDEDDPNPVGMPVIGADDKSGGTVKDIWIDPPEHLIRYLEVDVGDGATKLFPINLCVISGSKNSVQVLSLTSGQFKGIPDIKGGGQITRLEEEKIFGYFGAGTLYATPGRSEPIL